MGVCADINALVVYAESRGLISPLDRTYIRNVLCDVLGVSSFCDEAASEKELCEILSSLCGYAAENGKAGRTQTESDLFDTRIMGVLTPRPAEVISKFCELYLESPEAATEWYYNFSQDTDYIRRYRMCRDVKWQVDTEYGALDITINLAKPEKDPREIARLKNVPDPGYPACVLCAECEGYAGREDFPARQNHRIIPVEISGELWHFQYSPYVYYNEHCIVFNHNHVPMRVDGAVFAKLFDFIDAFPHYFVGSNAGLPIVGGSILSHEHFQGGRYTFAIERAEVEKEYRISGFEDVTVARMKWPMSTIRLKSRDRERITALAGRIFDKWHSYTDEASFVFANTGGEEHNTVTPIARRYGEEYELDIVLRNNITTDEFPMGVFHPHKNLHHIKRENIGLIEVMGLAVLPARLKRETELLCQCAKEGRGFDCFEETKKHKDWAERVILKKKADETWEELFFRETGYVFLECLKDAGVFKRDAAGISAFDRFISSI
ncbi:MAG: UDP-glucose--hexose-1-phosphate uridylyltransferase [Oscillospiraceae bacterium]|nr:UDP-glucose--hexose-1-phosphate uridylyltransferase [Oscillospiraceae bacterium]